VSDVAAQGGRAQGVTKWIFSKFKINSVCNKFLIIELNTRKLNNCEFNTVLFSI
jgi:hypothetical protein